MRTPKLCISCVVEARTILPLLSGHVKTASIEGSSLYNYFSILQSYTGQQRQDCARGRSKYVLII